MASRKQMLLRITAIAALMLLAIWVAVRYRFVRVEKIEVVDKEVQAILEQAADTLSMNSFRRNNALFLSSTVNSFYLFSRSSTFSSAHFRLF